MAGLDQSRDANVLSVDLTLQQKAQKRCASAAAGTPQAKKKASHSGNLLAGHLLSKEVASLSSDMAEMKRLLQNLQPADPVPTAAVASTEDIHSHSSSEEPTFSPYDSHSPYLDVMSTCASDTHFQDHLPTEVPELHDKPVGSTGAGGSGEGSLHSSENAPHPVDDTLEVLRMARLGLDECPAHPAQSNVFFRRPSPVDSFAMPACKDFMAEFSNALKGPGMAKRQSKTARTLASMAEAESIGVRSVPEIEQPVAALVVSPDEALQGNVRCTSA